MRLPTWFFSILFPCTLAAQPASPLLFIADTTNHFDSIEQILEREEFRGKVVYIDIWGTSCKPCIQEFAHIQPLKQQFESREVVFLYLCSPNSLNRESERANIAQWGKMVEKHQLSPANVYLSAACYGEGFWEKYKEKYTESRMYGIPVYLIADRNGKIVDFDAPRPSRGGLLYEEIEHWLKQDESSGK